MPIDSSIDQDRRLIIAKCSGLLTLQDFIDYHRSVWCLPEVFGFNELFDARNADTSQLSYSDLLNLVASAIQLHNVLPQSKSAVLIQNDAQRQLYEFYLTARENFSNNSPQIAAFNNRDAALTWLG